MNGYDIIKKAHELFKLRETDPLLKNRTKQSLGALSPNGTIYAYGYPALFVDINVSHKDSQYKPHMAICSIDDHGLSFHANWTSEKKANYIYDKMVKFINNCEFICPTKESVFEFCEQNGLTADYW